MKISELQPRTGNADVEGEITAIEPPRTFSKFGKDGRVANATVKDDSGQVTLTLWNDQIDQVKVGDRVRITKGWVSEWQGESQLSTGKFGSLEVMGSSGEDTSGDNQPKEHPKNQNTSSTHTTSPKNSTPRALTEEDIDDEISEEMDEEDV